MWPEAYVHTRYRLIECVLVNLDTQGRPLVPMRRRSSHPKSFELLNYPRINPRRRTGTSIAVVGRSIECRLGVKAAGWR